ncbi:endothelial zinc finger protein induced by tumor necrosis factor alpha-like [Nerophis ophidion]|uniref:endothelial zinc finger protein induced by tumor necrosis factor alpha-like n=1 Tax=Nerophis ophidion TaxID=159077 RepID=UPI002AE0AC95|nr:endothelial zinc finger protein induced by tumor necrosis factor alpha-like [Nerophis ophidion]
MLKELVQERLMAAADEIFALFEGTIASYEEELSRTREKERHRQPEAASKTVLHFEDVQQLIGPQEECPPQLQGWITSWEQEDPQPPHIKEEKDKLGIPQCLLGSKGAGLTKSPQTGVPVKTEDDEEKPPESSRLHHSPSEENRGAEPPSSSLLQHKTTEMDADHFGAPLSDSDTQDRVEERSSSDTNFVDDLRIHTDYKHSKCFERKTKCWTCSFCVKSFFYKAAFARHMRTHTGEKPFACSVCGQRFSQKSHLISHMRTHTREKPFACSVCNKRFSLKSNLTVHSRTHTGEKPFTCLLCGQKFAVNATLATHMRVHTGVKPFVCPVCGKTFSQRPHLKSHMGTHATE